MAKKREIPDLSNATPAFLIDQIALQREIQKDAKFLEGIYRQALESRRDPTTNVVEGEKYTGQYVTSARESVNAASVREAFPPTTHPHFYNVTQVTQLNVAEKTP